MVLNFTLPKAAPATREPGIMSRDEMVETSRTLV